MRPRSWVRLIKLAVLATAVGALCAGYVVASAPAGNRNPTLTFEDFPGPHQITFGKNVAYSASLQNSDSSNFTHVIFSMSRPSTQVSGSTVYANLLYASCDTDGTFEGLTATSYACPEIATIGSGTTTKIVLVWQTSSVPPTTTCSATTDCQLTTTSKWIIKEGTGHPGSSGPDTFTKGPVLTGLLVQPDPVQAGGYPIVPCTSIGNPTLVTNEALDPTTNQMATSVCAPVLPQGDALNPGLVVAINEHDDTNPNDPGFTQVSDICIPGTGQTCPETSPFHFPSSNLATFVFVYDNRALGKKKITQMFRDGQPVSSSPGADPNCQIVVDNSKKITTATCHSSTNSSWRGG